MAAKERANKLIAKLEAGKRDVNEVVETTSTAKHEAAKKAGLDNARIV